MKIKRVTEIETEKYKVGDVIAFRLKSGEYVEAMAVEKRNDKTVFLFVDCLHQEYQMNQTNTTEGGWEKSLLRKVLNRDILSLFPDDLREKMQPFDNGDMLTIPSLFEIFGENPYTHEKQDGKQWKLMKDRRNRIAWQGSKTGVYEWYWLRDVVSSPAFAGVHHYGHAGHAGASYSFGIRPAFQI